MYTTLEHIKQHLNIDLDFHDDDQYLTYLYEVAESVVQRHICCVLTSLCDETGALPAPVLHAILLYIGDLYNNRESIAFGGNPTSIPFSYQFLIDLYMNYADTTSNSVIGNHIDDIAKQVYINNESDLISPTKETYIDDNGDLQIKVNNI